MNLVTVVGARPQFIKASPVSQVLQEYGHNEYIVHTGQHYDTGMSQVFFDELGIPSPACNLEIGSGSHAEQTAGMLQGLERILLQQNPDCVLVYGDTNSTLAGALTASKLGIPVIHVEAGLRSFNKRMPEEINRIIADQLADLLFAPTETAAANLRNEGIPANKIFVVGDVMYDAALKFAERAEKESSILNALSIRSREYILATIHRAENTDDAGKLKNIFSELAAVARHYPVILPLHPRTRGALERSSLLKSAEGNLQVIEPIGYLDMVQLERNAAVIATDSGGVQKEAFFYHVPCVTLRTETEWGELVELGWNRLCPPGAPNSIAGSILEAVGSLGQDGEPYGKGDSARKIVRVMTDWIK